MFGTSGIRGRMGGDVTAETALSVGRAVATWGADTVVVGRDARGSGTVLEAAVTAGLRECGADVIQLGCVATPTGARAVQVQGADAGVILTASHNPPPDNGIKLWTPSGQAFNTEQRAAISAIVANDEYTFAAWDALGDITEWGGAEAAHREALREAGRDLSGLSVAVDVGNGVGGITADVLYELGADVTTLNAQEDGRFPGRASEPTPETCRALRSHVGATDTDLGIAHDGDADRMLAVDEHGSFVSGDELLAVFGQHAAGPGDRIAAPLNTSLAVDDALKSVGATVSRTPVGDVFVAERATEDGVVFGGEPSGAWIWPAETLCPDGPLAAIKLAVLVKTDGPVSSLTSNIDDYPLRRDSIDVTDVRKSAVMKEITQHVQEVYTDVATMDGVRIETDEGWFLIRPSGTEALLRLTAQARSQAHADDLLEDARYIAKQYID